jgi:DNA processing protein
MDLEAAIAVSMLPISRGRASATFRELREHNRAAMPIDLLDALGVAAGPALEMEQHARTDAQRALRAARDLGIEPVAWFDPRYPALLNCIPDPPPVLWVLGDIEVIGRPAVAVIGSRAATTYALDVGARLAAELASRNIVVTSGLARGVDSSAHRGCLEAGGATIAVLGSGLDRIYPAEHEELASAIAGTGALVSELGPGGAPLPEHFPLRNRIISGLSLAVVVVEANERSGSLITARCAMEQGRDVMAVPGSVLSGRNRGSHSLLKDGAKFVETADDILEELGWAFSTAAGSGPSANASASQDPLLARMDPGEIYDLDELVSATGQPAAKLLTRLMELELLGHVVTAGRGRFSRPPIRRRER